MKTENRGGKRVAGPGKKLGAPKRKVLKSNYASIHGLESGLKSDLKDWCKANGRTIDWALHDMVARYIGRV